MSLTLHVMISEPPETKRIANHLHTCLLLAVRTNVPAREHVNYTENNAFGFNELLMNTSFFH